MNKVLVVISVIVIGLIIVTGCGGGGGGGGPVTPASKVSVIQLAPDTATIPVGGTVIVTALALDSSGAPLPILPTSWTWTTNDGSVATVTPNGDRVTLTGVKAGGAIITAKESGSGKVGHVTATITAASSTGTGSGSTTTTSSGSTTTTSSGGATTSTSSGSTTTSTSTGGSTTSTSTGGTTSTSSGGTTSTSTGSTTTSSTGGSTGGGTGGPTGGTVFKSYDFESGDTTGWSSSKISATPTGGRKFLGEFAAESATLNLSGIPAHTVLNVTFDFFAIRTWDGNNIRFGPTPWDLSVDGTTLLHTTFANINNPGSATSSSNVAFFQAYPGTFPGASHPYQSGASEVNTLGFLFKGTEEDSVYHLSFDTPHSASTAAIVFTSLQNSNIYDESWGLDNVVVSYK